MTNSVETSFGNMFLGVVEDRKDPLMLGRVRVRCFGYHTKDIQKIPTESLPWADVIQINNNVVDPPKDGSWVIGFFKDNEFQCPVVFGVISGIPSESPNFTKGFCDQRESNGTLINYPKKITSKTYHNDGTGVTIDSQETYTYPESINQPTTSNISRNENIETTIIQERKDNVVEDIPIAKTSSQSTRSTYNEPETDYNAVYPFDNVKQTESGHVFEIDDTPGHERIHTFHRTGTFEEIQASGDKVVKVVGDDYNIVLKNKSILVEGNVNITVNNNANIYVKGNCITEVDGDVYEHIKGNKTTKVNGSVVESIDGSKNISCINKFEVGANPIILNGQVIP